jgi:hypothetical protein
MDMDSECECTPGVRWRLVVLLYWYTEQRLRTMQIRLASPARKTRQRGPSAFSGAAARSQPSMAATNKYLAQSNKSRTGGNATKNSEAPAVLAGRAALCAQGTTMRMTPPLAGMLLAAMTTATARLFEQLGVEVRLGAGVTESNSRGVSIGAERIESRTIIWAAGVKASPAAEWLGAEHDGAGRVKVEPDLSVPGHPNITHCRSSGDRRMSRPIAASATVTTALLTNTRQLPRLDAASTLVLPCAPTALSSESARPPSVRIRGALLTT